MCVLGVCLCVYTCSYINTTCVYAMHAHFHRSLTSQSVGLEQEEKALVFVREARDIVNTQLEKEAGYLSMLCYNFGLDAFQKGKHESSTTWLRESYELGQGCADVGAQKQVCISTHTCIRLVCTVCMYKICIYVRIYGMYVCVYVRMCVCTMNLS